MTDAETYAAPNGTKRRGSIDEKDEEQSNAAAPDIAPNSDEEPQPQPQPQSKPTQSSDQEKKDFVAEALSSKQAFRKATGHRRRNTDTALSYNPSTKLFKSANTNAKFIQMMQNDLPMRQRLEMQEKGKGLKLERELKHLQIKLRETQDQCNTAVEIIGKLEEEKEDLLSVNDMLRTQLGAEQTEVKILDQKNKSLEELYRSDTQKYKEEVDHTKKQLSELADDMTHKDMALNQAKEYQNKLQQQLNEDADESNGNVKGRGTKKEKQLLQEQQVLQSKLLDKNNQIQELMRQLETAMRAQHEKEGLQKDIDSFAEMAQQDLMVQREQIDKMTNEIIMLGSRNSGLEKERDDLMQLLEERDYENQMLKTGYGLHRSKTTKESNLISIASQIDGLTGGDDDFDDTLNLEFMANKQPMYGDNIEDYEQNDTSEEYENQRDSLSDVPRESPVKRPVKEVADVTREYLHLTASVVQMKFPRVQTLPSEDLINKVKNYQFWEYHEMMVRMMKVEEAKMLAKEKAEREEKLQAAQAANAKNQSSGMLGRFRNFFGSRADNNTGSSRQRGASATQKSKSGKTRERNKSATNKQQAPTMEDAKKKLNEVGKKAKDLKNTTVKKMTNKPSDEESAKLSQMSFQSIAELPGIYDDNKGKGKTKKPAKPDQGL